ncbi:MAG: ribbon-helix-helix domain-containing protein [archaeon]
MATQMITLKLNDKFLKEIDAVVKKGNYQNRTEFIRNALRAKIKEAELEDFRRELKKLQGAGKKEITPEQYEWARQKAFEQISEKLK